MYLDSFKSDLITKIFIILVALIPFSFIAGNLIINLNIVIIIFVAFTIFAEVTFRNFGLFLGADQIVQNSVPAIVFLQVPFAIVSGTMLRTTLIYEFCSRNSKIIINVLSFLIGMMLFLGIAVGGWTDMIKGWEIREYQGIGAIEFPVYIVRTVIIFAAIIIVYIYASLIIDQFRKKNN